MLQSAYQHTVKTAIRISGLGVHSGAPATLTIKPAPAHAGITFIRTDVRDHPNLVPARWDAVTDTRLCTVLSNASNITVSTVEHILSACAALGLDNAAIEIDGPEVPIMDGSAQPFVTAIDTAGLVAQNAARRMIRILKPVTFKDGDKQATLMPAPSRVFSFEIDFATPLIGRQNYTHEVREATYRNDIAPARTFGFLHEVEALRKMGLARGGSLDNAIVIDGDKVMNPGGLRFKDEFVRHKILDALGDLYLAGAQIIGHYQGVRAGHAMNSKLLGAMFARPDCYEIIELAKTTTRTGTARSGGIPAMAIVTA